MKVKIEGCAKGKLSVANYMVRGSACAVLSYMFLRSGQESSRPVQENSQPRGGHFSGSAHFEWNEEFCSSPNPRK